MSTEHHHAYQIALKTLKERCDHLQSKLQTVEEENSQLKLQIPQDVVKKSPRTNPDVDDLKHQIAQLTEQKIRLSHQVQLITVENQNLWARLSKFTSGNDNYESKSSVRDDCVKCVDGNVSYHSDLEISKVPISPDNARESLEEVSLKLNALIMDKRGGSSSEFQNSNDLYVYKKPVQMENFAFSSSDNNAPMLNGFKDHIIKLKQFKQILQNNKSDLTSAITMLKNFRRNNLCSDCGKTFSIKCDANSSVVSKVVGVVDHLNDLPTLQVHEVGLDATDEINRQCPICLNMYSDKDFVQHVTCHFSDDEDYDVTSTWVVPNTLDFERPNIFL